jgi:hypothetical protein
MAHGGTSVSSSILCRCRHHAAHCSPLRIQLLMSTGGQAAFLVSVSGSRAVGTPTAVRRLHLLHHTLAPAVPGDIPVCRTPHRVCCGRLDAISWCVMSHELSGSYPVLLQDQGFRRSGFRRQLGHGRQIPQSVRFAAGDGEGGVNAGLGKAETWLLLATHTRLLQFNYISGDVRIIHEGKVRPLASCVIVTESA